ncbi:MAG: hypothetical protein AAGF99_07270 [Bacteroidota bacterium]
MTPRRSPASALVRAAAAPVLFLGLAFWAALRVVDATGGAFVYPLDDPYIHLAVAENLAQGHYGLNLATPSSPASSVVWPGLLAAGLALGAGGWVALVLNLGLGVWTLEVARRLGSAASGTSNAGTGVAVAAVLVLNLPALALIGMEHVLQLGLTLAAWLGLVGVAHGACLAGRSCWRSR